MKTSPKSRKISERKQNYVRSAFHVYSLLVYEKVFMEFLSKVSLKQADLVKKILLELPKKALHNFENPIILSEFITHFLNQDEDVEL